LLAVIVLKILLHVAQKNSNNFISCDSFHPEILWAGYLQGHGKNILIYGR
jgi:hypothetical protein